MNKGKIIVIGGKGGVGKTALSAILVKLLLQRNEKLLLIDADPVISVTYAVGVQPQRTIGEFRERIIENIEVAREVRKQATKDTIRELTIQTGNNFDILVMGRSEGKGCFCGINDLLRYGIESLCSEYDTILIDCEAGIEQVNRRAVHRIDHLILITDTSRRGMETVSQVKEVAGKYFEDNPFEVSLLVNRVRSEEDEADARALAEKFGFAVAGFIPEDPQVLKNNARGNPLLHLPDNAPSVSAIRRFLDQIL
ncbi:AAA family ATPase [Dehalobacter sp. DCM]|uniref:nucleotide-binding protein n=1 Tax=Dehalobacter sp. DCM TaxID=2907827 RepID=UPI003081D877|nr:AAA family ATPase [Dehalobacter sp. DCM]